MERSVNVATPLAAATESVPESAPPAGLLAIASVTVAPEAVTMFPAASSMATRTDGVMVAPAGVFTGLCWKASLAGAPADAVAVNGTDGSPENTALMRFDPALGPRVHWVL